MSERKESIEGLLLESHYQLCCNAFNWTSMRPNERALSIIKEYSSILENDLEKLGENKGNYKDKFISGFINWMNAKSNCASSAITGGSNFNVRKAQKANERERTHSVNFHNWREKYFNAVNRVPTKSPEEELILAERKLEVHSNLQILMKEINVECRKFKKLKMQELINVLKEKEFPHGIIGLIDTRLGIRKIPAFNLTNNNATIKRLTLKVKNMESRISRKEQWEDIVFEGGYITIEDDRLKIFHDEKPNQDVIDNIKSNGFRWSPNWNCWCRKHTYNAVMSLRHLKFLKDK